MPESSQVAESSAGSRRVNNNISASQSQAGGRRLMRAGRRPDDDEEADDDDFDAQIEDLMAPLPKPQVDEQYLKNPLERETANAKLKSLTHEWGICYNNMQENLNHLGSVIFDVQEAKYTADIEGKLTGEDDAVSPCNLWSHENRSDAFAADRGGGRPRYAGDTGLDG